MTQEFTEIESVEYCYVLNGLLTHENHNLEYIESTSFGVHKHEYQIRLKAEEFFDKVDVFEEYLRAKKTDIEQGSWTELPHLFNEFVYDCIAKKTLYMLIQNPEADLGDTELTFKECCFSILNAKDYEGNFVLKLPYDVKSLDAEYEKNVDKALIAFEEFAQTLPSVKDVLIPAFKKWVTENYSKEFWTKFNHSQKHKKHYSKHRYSDTKVWLSHYAHNALTEYNDKQQAEDGEKQNLSRCITRLINEVEYLKNKLEMLERD